MSWRAAFFIPIHFRLVAFVAAALGDWDAPRLA